jgi:3-hydroxy acid dehydrogenase/malonic semialdehyde reductase
MKGKWILITGATSGIGKATAEIFAKNGANLIITGRRNDRLEEIKVLFEREYKVQVITFCFDVREFDKVSEMANDLKSKNITPDVLINNAGLASGKNKVQEGILSDWEVMIDTNIKGLLYVTRSILPFMIVRNDGHVINIGSIAGHQVYLEGNVYNATKFAVKALTEATNLDMVGTDLRCSCIDPGAVESEFSEVRYHGDKERAEKVYEGFHPLSPVDVADAIFYVANAPKHVNITTLVIQPTAQRSVSVLSKKI